LFRCYRLAFAEYDVPNQRFYITSGPHRSWILANVYVKYGGSAYMRFKSESLAFVLHDTKAYKLHLKDFVCEFSQRLWLRLQRLSSLVDVPAGCPPAQQLWTSLS
jgi:hypothetical protein